MGETAENQKKKQVDFDLRQQNEFLYELSDVTVEMLNESDVNELCQRIAEKLLGVTGGYSAYIAIENDTGEEANIRYFAGSHALNPPERLARNLGIGGTAWAENRIIFTRDYHEYGLQLDFAVEITQACALPINCKLGRGGVICILYDNSDIDVEAQIDLLQKFEKIVAAALDNTRSHQSKYTELKMLEAMMKINQAIYESTEYTDIVDSVCQMILEGFNANRARVYRFVDGEFEGLAGRILTEEKTREDELPPRAVLTESANLWTVKNLKAVHVKVNTDDDRESAFVHEYRRKTGIGCSYIAPLISDGKAWGVLSVHKPRGQSDFTDTEIRLIDLLASQLSVTINRQRLMQEIEYQANHDHLTGCVGRARFETILGERITQAQSAETQFSLMFVDLDGFKKINDTLGHAAGDMILINVANHIRKLLIEEMCVARLGGDEFAILCPLGSTREQASKLGFAIAGGMNEYKTDSTAVANVYASVGIARFPDDGENAGELLTSADIAMYHAKRNGSGVVREFDCEFAARYTRRLKLQSRIEKALERDEFELHYQPKVRTSDGQVVGVEALIRWNEPEFSSVSPTEWIPLAEENGTINEIGRWVGLTSLKFLKEIKKYGMDLKVSMNISATQFDASSFPQRLLEDLKQSGTPGSSIELEITETAVIKDIDQVVSKLNEIRAYGISIAIDDFGVKYSSLAYLADLPIDVVKIDRVFVNRMDASSGRSMLEPILLLSQLLGLETVVEGVETEKQKDAVIALGCDQIQGYYYSKPVPFRQLPGVVKKINSRGGSIKRNAA